MNRTIAANEAADTSDDQDEADVGPNDKALEETLGGGSTLDPDAPRAASERLPGTDTGALGPSDSSDSGSDVRGGPGLTGGDQLPLDRGTTGDGETGRSTDDAGPDSGDVGLDSDSDRYGTGERIGAGRDPRDGSNVDVSVDRVIKR